MPVETAVALYIAKKLRDRLEDNFEDAILRRWSRHRASAFFESFVAAFGDEGEGVTRGDDVDGMVAELIHDDAKSEALFDAYRRVALSASKEVGPRIIAFLTADLLNAGEEADFTDEVIFRAAETFSDRDFREMVAFLDGRIEPATRADGAGDGIDIEWHSEGVHLNRAGEEYHVGPLDVGEALGGWALKLQGLGGLTSSVRQKEREYGVSHYIDEPGTERITSWFVHFPAGTSYLLRLTLRALQAVR